MSDERKVYVVEIADLYDTDVREVIRVTAYGPNDIRNQVRESYPGWSVRGSSPLCQCGHREHADACKGGASSPTTYLPCSCTERTSVAA